MEITITMELIIISGGAENNFEGGPILLIGVDLYFFIN
jgi:hypothetical protein